ncbi:MAG: hypothetical protein ACI90V_013933 [Bacillariaceae sp.]
MEMNRSVTVMWIFVINCPIGDVLRAFYILFFNRWGTELIVTHKGSPSL